jgi:hypothetical protein
MCGVVDGRRVRDSLQHDGVRRNWVVRCSLVMRRFASLRDGVRNGTWRLSGVGRLTQQLSSVGSYVCLWLGVVQA